MIRWRLVVAGVVGGVCGILLGLAWAETRFELATGVLTAADHEVDETTEYYSVGLNPRTGFTFIVAHDGVPSLRLKTLRGRTVRVVIEDITESSR